MDIDRIEERLRASWPHERTYTGHLASLTDRSAPVKIAVRARGGVPVGLSAAAVGLVLVVVAGAVLFGGSRGSHAGASPSASGEPTAHAGYSAPASAAGLTILQPTIVASFGADKLTSVVRGPGAAAYVLDGTTETVYRVDLQTGARLPVFKAGEQAPSAGGAVRAADKPRLLATGGGDVLILDESTALWRWHPAVGDTTGRGVLSEVNIEDHVVWGTNVRAIGTFLIDSQIHSYNIYVVSPSEWQVIKYYPAVDGSGYPSAARENYLSVSTDLSSVDDLYIDGKIYLVDKGKITRYILGQAVDAWAPAQPPGSRTEKPFYTRLTADNSAQDQGTFYAYDSANQRIVAFAKNSGAFMGQFMAPSDTAWFSALTGMFVTTDASGAVPTIYWTESGALMKAELRPPVTSTSSSAPATNESITYRVADGDDVTAIADRFSMAVWELELANPQIKDFSSMEPGTILTIPAPGSQDTFQYVVVAGDDLQSISDRFNVRLWELEFANPRFSAIDEPPVGTILTIPAPASQANVPTPLPMPSTFQYRVIAGDSAQSIADKFAVQLRDLESANPQIHDFTYLPVGTVLNIPLPIFRAPSTASPNPS